MTMRLAGNASTQSRARRPLPPGAVRGMTLGDNSPYENVRFDFTDGLYETRRLLSWVGGQAGLLWGSYEDELRVDAPGSYGHETEYDLADRLGEVYSGLLSSDNMACRFFANGGDACAAAVRVALAVTWRDAIATQGYHGAATDFAHEPAALGYPKANLDLHRRFEFGDIAGMNEAIRGAACVMVEVPAWDDDAAIATFLSECRRAADAFAIPLIIDDVVCGFRLALGGSCEAYGVKADMVCLGKALSPTGCVSALVGRKDMIGRLGSDVFYSTTFGGSPGLCAGAAFALRWLTEHRKEIYEHLNRIGTLLKYGFNARGIRCVGQPERSVFEFPSESEWLSWCSRMIGQGIMVHRPNFPTLAHIEEHVEETMRAVEAIR